MTEMPERSRTTALVADDEEAPRAQLRAALERTAPDLAIVAECVNGVDAWDAWLELQPDVCFLDIRMPGLSGIDVARRIAGRSQVVFVTAYGDHALEAFDAGAVDYLVKPIDAARVERMADRLRVRRATSVATELHPLLQTLAKQIRRPPLTVIQSSAGRQVRLIPVDEIAYFEADSRYTRVVHDGGDAFIRTPLKELLGQLDDDVFWQIHRSLIVDRRRIVAATRIDEGSMEVTLRGRPERLPVSRPFQPLFRGQ